MIDIEKRLSDIVSDLGLDRPFVKGQPVHVRNCWHFYSSGDSVDALFKNAEDFREGMNRIFVVSYRYDILIVAFVLMDTHVHFILYGEFEECSRFVHEYVRITSMYLSSRHMEYKSLKNIEIAYQVIEDDRYLRDCRLIFSIWPKQPTDPIHFYVRVTKFTFLYLIPVVSAGFFVHSQWQGCSSPGKALFYVHVFVSGCRQLCSLLYPVCQLHNVCRVDAEKDVQVFGLKNLYFQK